MTGVSQSGAPGSAPESLLEMQVLRPYPRPTDSVHWGGMEQAVSTSPPGNSDECQVLRTIAL